MKYHARLSSDTSICFSFECDEYENFLAEAYIAAVLQTGRQIRYGEMEILDKTEWKKLKRISDGDERHNWEFEESGQQETKIQKPEKKTRKQKKLQKEQKQ